MSEQLRPELPPLVPRLRHLHVRRGYPVPWFVTWFEDDVHVPAGEGEPDFRVMDEEKLVRAVKERRCWVCGSRLGKHMTFVLGPMCAVNRTSAEPPSHRDCADWSARACPFLTRPHMVRNEGKPKSEESTPAAGMMLKRNPGVTMLWTTQGYRVVNAPGGVLFRIGAPEHIHWLREGRDASRAEVQESIRTGLPALEAVAREQEGAMLALALEVKRAEALLPA